MIPFLLTLPAALIVAFCWTHRRLDAPDDQDREVCHIGLANGIALGGFLLVAWIPPAGLLWQEAAKYAGIFAGFALAFALLTPIGCLQRIRYGASGVTIRTCLGRVHHLAWHEITEVSRYNPNGLMYLCTAERKIRFSSMPGCDSLLHYARGQCRRLGVDPTPSRSRLDVFHGHVANPAAFIISWCFVGLSFAIIAALLIVTACLAQPVKTDSLLHGGAMAAAAILWLIRCLWCVKVGRHPEKYGRATFERCFGKGSYPRTLRKPASRK